MVDDPIRAARLEHESRQFAAGGFLHYIAWLGPSRPYVAF